MVRILYKFPYHPNYEPVEPATLGAGYDAQSIMAWALRNFPWARGKILQTHHAAGRGQGDHRVSVYGTWGETLESSRPTAASFSAALFCDRTSSSHTLEALCTAFSRAGGSTAVTLRFVKGGPGRAAVAGAVGEHARPSTATGPEARRTLRAYMHMLEALESQGIPHTLHWGKFNNLTPRGSPPTTATTWCGGRRCATGCSPTPPTGPVRHGRAAGPRPRRLERENGLTQRTQRT